MTWPSVWVLREDVTFIRYKSSTCLCLAHCLWPFSAPSVTYSRVKGITQIPQDSRCWSSQSAIPLVFLKCSSGWDELWCHILTHICACFSSNNQIPTNELIYSVQWMFLVLKIQTSLPGSPWNILTGCCLPDCILMWKGHSSEPEKPHQVLSQLALHTGMGKDWKIEVFLLMFISTSKGWIPVKTLWRSLLPAPEQSSVLPFGFTL